MFLLEFDDDTRIRRFELTRLTFGGRALIDVDTSLSISILFSVYFDKQAIAIRFKINSLGRSIVFGIGEATFVLIIIGRVASLPRASAKPDTHCELACNKRSRSKSIQLAASEPSSLLAR